MLPEVIPVPECLITQRAGDGDFFHMVAFNMIFYLAPSTFLSANLTNIGFNYSLFIDSYYIFPSSYHGFNLFIQFFQIPGKFMFWKFRSILVLRIRYVLHVVAFNMIFYLAPPTFLSTNLTNIGFYCSFIIHFYNLFTSTHHGFNLFVQFSQFPRKFIFGTCS